MSGHCEGCGNTGCCTCVDSEREAFEKWCSDEFPCDLDGYIKKHRNVLWAAWIACAELKQQELDAQDTRHSGMEEALATISAERDALAAHNKQMREALVEIRRMPAPVNPENMSFEDIPIHDQWLRVNEIAEKAMAISSAAPDCLREHDAQVLEEAAEKIVDEFDKAAILRLAAAKRGGERCEKH